MSEMLSILLSPSRTLRWCSKPVIKRLTNSGCFMLTSRRFGGRDLSVSHTLFWQEHISKAYLSMRRNSGDPMNSSRSNCSYRLCRCRLPSWAEDDAPTLQKPVIVIIVWLLGVPGLTVSTLSCKITDSLSLSRINSALSWRRHRYIYARNTFTN